MRTFPVVAVVLCSLSSAALAQAEAPPTPPPPPPVVETPAEQPAPSPPAARAEPRPRPQRDHRNDGDGTEPERWRRTRVSVAPLPTLFLAPNFELEYAVSPRISTYLSPRGSFSGLLLSALGIGNAWSAGLVGGARFFPQAEAVAPSGLWLAGEIGGSYARFRVEVPGAVTDLRGGEVTPMFLVGYTWMHEAGFAIAFGGGLGARLTIADRTVHPLLAYSFNDRLALGPVLGIHFNIGFAF